MPLLRNLSPNPACANNTTGITISPAGDWARSTSVDAGMPRTTGLEGTTATDVTWARSVVSEETQYVVSFTLHAIGAQNFNCLVNFYDAPSGGSFLGSSTVEGGGTDPVVLAAGLTQRFVIGPYTTPTDCESLALKLNDIDAGGLEVTGIRVAPYSGDLSADGAYADGGSTGWTWDSTAGSSTSTGRILPDAFTSSATFGVVSSDIGPVQRETYTLGQTTSITASGSITDPVTAVDGFLIMQLAYDAVRGRVRVSAFTFAASVTSVVVERKELNAARWTQIRGGTIPVASGAPIYQADDYEYPSGVTVDYRIRGLNASGVTVQSAVARRTGVVEPLWLKFIPRPSWNRRVEFLRDPITYERESRNSVYQVQGAELPVVVTDVHGSRRFPVQLVEHSLERARALDDVLRRGAPCFLHVPASVPIPSIYAAVGNYRMSRLGQFSQRWLFEIDLIEVAAPPPSVVGARTTWADVLAQYATWADVLAAKSTWAELID